MNDFNRIASVYDRLVRIVFGNEVRVSQEAYLGEISAQNSVLIVGGGTGKLLESLNKADEVVFLDKSEKMIYMAKKRSLNVKVEFLAQDLFNYKPRRSFDVIICPFFLDCFNEENLSLAIKHLKGLLMPNGRLFVTDFRYSKENPFAILMHLFFKITTNLESNAMKDIHECILNHGFVEEKRKSFYRDKIFSSIYRNL